MEFRELHDKWLQRRKEEKSDTTATGDIPAASVPQDLPDTITGIDGSSSALQGIKPFPLLRGVEVASDTFFNPRVPIISSPTLSISTASDFTLTELGEDIGEGGGGGQTLAHHDIFYLEDGNVEILCGDTVFRIHTSIVSFSSSRLRDVLSPSTLLNAPMPAGCPRVAFDDSAEDFAVLLKMISTPGFPTWYKVPEFTVFGSLLRMATKYGFTDVRDQLICSLEGAYPTKWEAYQSTNIVGEEVFGSPRPHPNAVLNLFLEHGIRFAIPLAAYRATLGGLSSLLSNEPGATLSRLPLASTIYGMEAIRSDVSRLAHSVVCDMSVRECRGGCVVDGDVNSPARKMKGLNRIYDAMVKVGGGDVLSPLEFGGIVCADCAEAREETYRVWCKRTWENLPRIFGVEEGWEES
ncbi:hypothetical protein BJ322DRAFT_144057 [Thelephora terrestris]|uniref:BTB domain-containing protein n=1 Tax=Thelephora terrestris TaxID=56493 RepID=A0A9P6HDZ8_9AGAM|nr:hypothetical protein BJ322DRAFT_144057 [Thelephora terrestris]